MKRTKKLQKICELGLEAVPPFNFKYTVYKPSHFPTKLEDFDEVNGRFYRTLRLSQRKLVGLRMSDLGQVENKPGIFVEVYSNTPLSSEELDNLGNHVSRSFGLKEDVDRFYKSITKKDPLQAPIKNLRGMRNSCFENLFEILNISSMLQNTTVKRSEQMMEAMLSNFGERVQFDGREFYVFYTPSDVAKSSEQRLRELKLGYRAKFLMGIADHFVKNPDLGDRVKEMNFEDAKERLMEIKGIGPYSASTTLFAFRRDPGLINFDVWNRKIFSNFLFGTDDKSVEEVSAEFDTRYGNYKGHAALYIIEDLFVRKPDLQYWRKKNETKRD
jgi:3-methyladenine DNA glycosylase/8-oxoguanine DNA glycosylase